MAPDRASETGHNGVAPEDLFRGTDYYALLGVDPSADTEEIHQQYRELTQEVHPDKTENSSAREQFIQLQEAMSVLSDDDRRWLYDHLGHDGYYNLVGETGSDLSMVVEMVERKIEQQDRYTPPVREMGPDVETTEVSSGDKLISKTSEGSLEKTVDNILLNISESRAGSGAPRPSASTVKNSGEAPPNRESSELQKANEKISGQADDGDSRPDTKREWSSDSTDVQPPQYTARTVTFDPPTNIKDWPAVWDYWRLEGAHAESSRRSVSTYVAIIWLIRSAVLAALLSVASLVPGVIGESLYPVALVVLSAAGGASSLLLKRTVPLGASWSSDPGMWRWPQSVGRILIGIAVVQLVLARESVWAAFPRAIDAEITPGIWEPAAADPVVTQVFVLLTICCLVAGAGLVAVGLSWRLWTDRLAGGYDIDPTVIELTTTGVAGVVAVLIPVLAISESPVATIPLPTPEIVSTVLPGVASLHVGLIAAVGIALLPSAYRLWIARISRVVPDTISTTEDD